MNRPYLPLLLPAVFFPTAALCAEVPTMGSMFFKMTWALLIVAGLILILYAVVRKRMGAHIAGGGKIRILEVKPVMYRNSLALIEVQGKEMLIGINQSGVQLLTEFPQADGEGLSFQETLDRQ